MSENIFKACGDYIMIMAHGLYESIDALLFFQFFALNFIFPRIFLLRSIFEKSA